MAKKVRRVKKKNKRSVPVTENGVEQAAETVLKKVTAAEAYRQEYAYVIKDLRRLLLVSAAMFILLIALNLILQV